MSSSRSSTTAAMPAPNGTSYRSASRNGRTNSPIRSGITLIARKPTCIGLMSSIVRSGASSRHANRNARNSTDTHNRAIAGTSQTRRNDRSACPTATRSMPHSAHPRQATVTSSRTNSRRRRTAAASQGPRAAAR